MNLMNTLRIFGVGENNMRTVKIFSLVDGFPFKDYNFTNKKFYFGRRYNLPKLSNSLRHNVLLVTMG